MNHLKCNVKECRYNNFEACNKDEIMVDESSYDATKCKSYASKTKDSYVTEMAKEFQMPDHRKTHITCKVDKCVHNHHYDCYAEAVDIVNEAKGDSRCKTFEY